MGGQIMLSMSEAIYEIMFLNSVEDYYLYLKEQQEYLN